MNEYSIPRPRTRADCRDEARPCPWVGCRHHLLLEVATTTGEAADARPPTLRLNRPSVHVELGRRPGLHAGAAAAVVRAWIVEAVEALALMPYTCALDVVEAYPDGLAPRGLALLLGVTGQAVDADVRELVPRLREGLAAHEDHDELDIRGALV